MYGACKAGHLRNSTKGVQDVHFVLSMASTASRLDPKFTCTRGDCVLTCLSNGAEG